MVAGELPVCLCGDRSGITLVQFGTAQRQVAGGGTGGGMAAAVTGELRDCRGIHTDKQLAVCTDTGKALKRFWPRHFFVAFYAVHLALLGALATL